MFRMRLRAVFAFVAVLFAAAAVVGCAKKEEPTPAAAPAAPAASPASPVAEGKALFEQKCGVCHDLDRATGRAETRTSWAEIVKTMQMKKADWISDAEAAKILEFLATEHGKK